MRSVVAIAIAASAACASSGLEGNIYHGEGYAYRVEAPERGWTPFDAGDGVLAFRNEENNGTMMIHARCGQDSDDVPLQSLVQHLFLQFTEREVIAQETVPFDGREAIHTVLSAKLDGVRMNYDSWVLKKDGCVYDLIYLAPEASFERGQPAFQQMVSGFTTTVDHE